MIKFLPEIYPDEAFYSYLSRCFVRSGYIWNRGIANEIFDNPTCAIDKCFLNVFTPEFKKLLDEKIGLKNLILNHTLFKYYARFLPLEKRKFAFQSAMNNEPFQNRNLPIPQQSSISCLRYCPMCVEEDRLKYNEAYIHLVHTIPDIHTCTKHACNLVDMDLVKEKSYRTTFVPLEFVVKKKKPAFTNQESIDFRITKYITEVFNQPLDLTTELIIGNYLSNKLDDKYISPRGEQRNLEPLFEDIKAFYFKAQNFKLSKKTLGLIYRGLYYNPYEILLVSMFQNISPWTLCSYAGSSKPRHLRFDQTVRKLYQNGQTMHKIANTLHVNHEVVRQVLMGTYDKPHRPCSTYKCQRWDWEKIDNDCCRDFYTKVSTIDRKKVSKPTVAKLFGLKDKTLRNLPKLSALIKEFKSKQDTG